MTAPTAIPIAEAPERKGQWVPAPVRDLLRPAVRSMREREQLRAWLAMDRPIGDASTVRVGRQVHRFFFLSGCYRSGTNWVSSLLNLHPDIAIAGELHFRVLLNAMDKFTGRDWYLGHHGPVREAAEKTAETMVRRCVYAATRDKPEATWLGDHTPRHMRQHLPGAPHVLVVRDGRDVLVSFAYHILNAKKPEQLDGLNRRKAQQWIERFHADPVETMKPGRGLFGDEEWIRNTARAWAEFIRVDLPEVERMRNAGGRVHTVRYERLHENLEHERAALYEFFGLDPKLAQTPSGESRTTPGFSKADPRAFYRKGAVGDWRNHFDENASRIFKEEAGDELVHLGYARDRNW
jgi:hypothetical protein